MGSVELKSDLAAVGKKKKADTSRPKLNELGAAEIINDVSKLFLCSSKEVRRRLKTVSKSFNCLDSVCFSLLLL